MHKFQRGMELAIRAFTGNWDIRVVFEGKQAYTDGHMIVLPQVDVLARMRLTEEDVEYARAYLMALRGYGWHEALHITETQMHVMEEYVYRPFMAQLLNLLEDIRIEHVGKEKGPGVEEALHYTRELWVWPRLAQKKRERKGIDAKMLVQDAVLLMQVAAKHKLRAYNHELWDVAHPASASMVDRWVDTLNVTSLPGTREVAQLCEQLDAAWRAEHVALTQHASVAPKWDEKGAPRVLLVTVVDNLAKYLKAGGEAFWANPAHPRVLPTHVFGPPDAPECPVLDGKPVVAIEVPPFESDPKAPVDADPVPEGCERTLVFGPPDDKEQAKKLAEAIAEIALIIRGAINEEAEEQAEEAKQEFHVLPSDEQPYLVYSTKYDQYVETRGNPRERERARDEVANTFGPIKKRLSVLLRTRVRERWRSNQEEGEELDAANLYQIALSQQIPQQKLTPFKARVEKDDLTETSVGLLVDVSGSMTETIDYRAGRTKLSLARLTAFAFSECLGLAVPDFAVWAFSNMEGYTSHQLKAVKPADRDVYARYSALYIETAKDFTERWSHDTAARVACLGMRNESNLDAEAVRWSAQQLLARKAKRRVLFVLSDGMPLTCEPRVQVARQQRYLREVVLAMRANGVEVVGIGIADRSVEQFYKPWSVVVHTVADLPRIVMSEMEFLLLNQKKRRT